MFSKVNETVFLWITFIFVLFAVPTTVFAQTQEQTLFTLQEEQDVTVTVTYENNDVTIELLSPSGKVITKDTDTDTITVLSGQKSTIFFLGQAEAGIWKIRYDKGSNNSISVSADVQDNSFFITDFKMEAVSGESVPVSFRVNGKDGTEYSYRVLATTDTDNLNGKELKSGYGYVGQQMDMSVPLNSLNTYDSYYLLLYVSYNLNGTEIFDFAFSGNSFRYTNSATPSAMDNVDIVIEYDLNKIVVDWENYIPYGADSVYINVYKGTEALSGNAYSISAGYSMEFPFEKGGVYSVEISYRNRNGMVSEKLKKNIATDKELLVLPDDGKVYSEQWFLANQDTKKIVGSIDVNGNTTSIELNSGEVEYITLPEERNKIVVMCRDEYGYTHCYRRTANVVYATPEIKLVRNIDGVNTKEATIVLFGTTNAEVLTVNATPVEVEDGTFYYKYELSVGENHIVMEAAIGDVVTRVNAVVTKESSVPDRQAYFIWGLAAAAVVIILVFLLLCIKRKIKYPEIPLLGIAWIVVLAAWLLYYYSNHYINSTKYLELAYESLSKANQLLERNEMLFRIAVRSSIVALIITFVCVIVRLILKYVKRKINK